jgi:hypothetical protein
MRRRKWDAKTKAMIVLDGLKVREHHLLVPPDLRRKAKRMPAESAPKPTTSNEWWSINMTEVLVQGCS